MDNQNPATRRVVNISVLSPQPLSCVNRDDAGVPKSVMLGGVQRYRWSSQSQKNALRREFWNTLDRELTCIRTRRLPLMVLDRLVEDGMDADEAAGLLVATFGKGNPLPLALSTVPTGKKVSGESDEERIEREAAEAAEMAEAGPFQRLGFTGRTQVITPVSRTADRELARLVAEHREVLVTVLPPKPRGSGADPHKEARARLTAAKKALSDEMNNSMGTARLVDVALFGRFLTEVPVLNSEAACAVAHAVGIHPDDYVTDFWSAIEDAASEQGHGGSANMGTQGLSSGTFYRFSALDVDELESGPLAGQDDLLRASVTGMVREFARLRPTAMKNATAPFHEPALVVVSVGPRARNLGDAFVRPVESDYLAEGAKRLSETLELDAASFGDEQRTFVLRSSIDTAEVEFPTATVVGSMDELVERVLAEVFHG